MRIYSSKIKRSLMRAQGERTRTTGMWLAALACSLFLTVSLQTESMTASASEASSNPPPRQIDWKTLLPERERNNPSLAPAPSHDYLGESNSIAALQTGSSEVNAELDGLRVRVPGFVVPLKSNAMGQVNEFFLVPYFGACIHVPPPPPNQMIYVKMRDGAELRSVEDAQWITGRLRTKHKDSSLGDAAYTLEGEKMEAYEY